MKCPVCNADNGADVNFCQGCGRRIPRCPTCGMELTNRDRFCSNDGTRLSDDLLLLVPEEAVLQEPVWVQPAADATPGISWDAPIPNDLEEGTVKAGPEPVVQESHPWTESFVDETARVTATSGGRGWQAPVTVHNNDPVSVPAWDAVEVKPQPPQRAFCENCGKRIAPGNRFCTECQSVIAAQDARPAKKSGKKIILIVILVILLLLGLCAGGYALLNSDLFDWDTPSSNHTNRDDEEEEEETEEEEEYTSEPAPAVEATDASVPGVEDPVSTEPVTEATTEPVAVETEPESDPLLYWIDNCDKMYLTAADLAGFDAQMCSYARNACYAKSGRMFNSETLQAYFSQFDWYKPTVSPDKFTNSMLNAYQVSNINVVLEYERAHGYN